MKKTQKKPTILNLACGKARIKGALNVDFIQTKYSDKTVNLARFPWPWKKNSVDEIYMINYLEHTTDLYRTLKEVVRILKPGGLFHCQCPYFSSNIALTEIDHLNAIGRNTFQTMEGGNYLFSKPAMKTEKIRINYLALLPASNKYIDFDFSRSTPAKAAYPFFRFLGWPFTRTVQLMINISPVLFERLWQYWVGGADEILYRGRKV